MKPSILALLHIFAAAGACALPLAAEEPAEAQPLFSPALEGLISSYRGAAVPVLPDIEPEVWAAIDSPCSAAPGRQRLPRHLLVDKPHTRLYVRNAFADTLSSYSVCASSVRGQKKKMDDCRTPEGDFRLMGIYDSTDWTYKDTDDKCYGPFFVSLITPRFYGIGIHGTNAPYSVPGRRSHGCMRMRNDDILRVRTMVDKDSHVIILPDPRAARRRLSFTLSLRSALLTSFLNNNTSCPRTLVPSRRLPILICPVGYFS